MGIYGNSFLNVVFWGISIIISIFVALEFWFTFIKSSLKFRDFCDTLRCYMVVFDRKVLVNVYYCIMLRCTMCSVRKGPE